MSDKLLRQVYVFDLDGTLSLCNPTGRVKYLIQDPKDWKAFHAACWDEMIEDPPNLDIIKLANKLHDFGLIYIITGRNEKYKTITEQWLAIHGIQYDRLFMRARDDKRQDAIIKCEMVWDFVEHIGCVFEDRDQCVNMYRELGLLCCQVAEGKF